MSDLNWISLSVHHTCNRIQTCEPASILIGIEPLEKRVQKPLVAAALDTTGEPVKPAATDCDLKIAAGWLWRHCDVCIHGHHM